MRLPVSAAFFVTLGCCVCCVVTISDNAGVREKLVETSNVYEISDDFEQLRVKRRTIPLQSTEPYTNRTILLIGYLAGSLSSSQRDSSPLSFGRFRLNDSELARPTASFESRPTPSAKYLEAFLTAVKTRQMDEATPTYGSTTREPGQNFNGTAFKQLVTEQGQKLLSGDYISMVGLKGHLISGAIRYVIEEINNDHYWLENYKLKFIFNNTHGHTQQSVAAVMYQWDIGVAAFIGPEDSCQVEATIAAAQNLPMISFKCLDYELSDKKKYPTFARTIPTQTQIVKAAIALLKQFKWNKFTVVYGKDPTGKADKYQPLYEKIKQLSVQEGMTILNVSTFDIPFTHLFKSYITKIEDIVHETKDLTRIYVFFGNENALRYFMYAMDSQHMLDNGEYMVVFLDPELHYANYSDAAFNYFYKPPGLTNEEFFRDERLVRIIEASKSLLAIIPRPINTTAERYRTFWQKVTEYNYEEPFNFILGKHLGATPMSTPYASYLYDAVRLYARGVQEQVHQGGDPLNGREIIKRIIGRTYKSIAGYDIYMDENGDAQGNYTLVARQIITSSEEKQRFKLSHAMIPTGEFISSSIPNQLPTLELVSDLKILWPNGKDTPPKDEPHCGFDGKKCIEARDYTIQIATGVIGAFVAAGLIVAFFIYRNWKYEQELAGLIWKIDLKDVHFRPITGPSIMAGSRMTLVSVESGEMIGLVEPSVPWNASNLATYKGSLVAVKEIRYAKKGREISRGTKIEMKKMRSLHHDNVNLFMGIIVQQSSVYIVREFCAKGSLFDVLLNENIKLDSLFMASFVDDLLKGVIYLHDSELKVHGNLKSKNCVITSRWSLQVGDYGLSELREGQEYMSDEQIFEDNLWTAPELLRQGHLIHKTKGTQKADVYAFGVILHEIMARHGPWDIMEDDAPEPREIVNKVMYSRGPTYCRPNVDSLECQDYIISAMTRCWAEQYEQRPDLRNVRNSLKMMFKEIHKRNIMDHMMGMMEKYQSQLEDLVDERTEQLQEEKKRTETLLLRMLPQSVATPLMQGEEVRPESYDQVTIYFSDIVQFTNLSSESTPMEVVNFLNALYTLFDGIIKHYGVYKVETIGDAYMVVSGLPIRNGTRHAGEIATLALHLLEAVKSFKIPHRPDKPLLLRIGIHTGPCVAGVVGTAMPRYCLFGDTVNTASRMESNGEALRIHISESTKLALDATGGYIFEERGLIEIKGKGLQRTFWLVGKEEGIVLTPENERNESLLPLPALFPVQPLKPPSKSNLTSYASTQKLRRTPSKILKEKFVQSKASPLQPSFRMPPLGGAAPDQGVGSSSSQRKVGSAPKTIQRWCSFRPPTHNSSFRVNIAPLGASAGGTNRSTMQLAVANLRGGVGSGNQSPDLLTTRDSESSSILRPLHRFRHKDAIAYKKLDSGKLRKRSMSYPDNVQVLAELEAHELLQNRLGGRMENGCCGMMPVGNSSRRNSQSLNSSIAAGKRREPTRGSSNLSRRSDQSMSLRHPQQNNNCGFPNNLGDIRRGSLLPVHLLSREPSINPPSPAAKAGNAVGTSISRECSVSGSSVRPVLSYNGPLVSLYGSGSLSRLSDGSGISEAGGSRRRLESIADDEHVLFGDDHGIHITVPTYAFSLTSISANASPQSVSAEATVPCSPCTNNTPAATPLPPPRKRSSSCPDASAVREALLNGLLLSPQATHCVCPTLADCHCSENEASSSEYLFALFGDSSTAGGSLLPASQSVQDELRTDAPSPVANYAKFNSDNYLTYGRLSLIDKLGENARRNGARDLPSTNNHHCAARTCNSDSAPLRNGNNNEYSDRFDDPGGFYTLGPSHANGGAQHQQYRSNEENGKGAWKRSTSQPGGADASDAETPLLTPRLGRKRKSACNSIKLQMDPLLLAEQMQAHLDDSNASSSASAAHSVSFASSEAEPSLGAEAFGNKGRFNRLLRYLRRPAVNASNVNDDLGLRGSANAYGLDSLEGNSSEAAMV